MSSCFSRCLRVPIAMRKFYEPSLWILQHFLLTHLDLHHRLLGQWLYIQSSALSRLPAPGGRLGPSNAPNMAKIVTPNATAELNPLPGANHYRLVGLEVTTASNQGFNPSTVPPTNCFTYFLFGQMDGGKGHPTQLPDSITFDRVYMHGSNTYDVREGIQGNRSE